MQLLRRFRGRPLMSAALICIVFHTGDAALAAPTFSSEIVDSTMSGDIKIVADIDNDGLKDLIVGGMPGEDLQWYQYPGYRKTRIAAATSEFTTDGEACDIDGDGDMDIVVPDGSWANTLYWFENPRLSATGTGDPFNTSQWRRHTIGSFSEPTKDVEIADFDGDGRTDIATRVTNRLYIHFQTAPRVWTTVSRTPANLGLEGMTSGDLDNDGDTDLVIRGAWLRNPGGSAARTLSGWSELVIGSAPSEFKALIANVDSDAAKEVLFSSSEGVADVVRWKSTNGDPAGSWTSQVIASNVERAHTLQAGDMDRDGDVDIVVGQMHTSVNRQLMIYLSSGGAAPTWTAHQVDQGSGIHSGVVADLGNDGDLDIFGANWTGNPPVRVWVNTTPAGGTPPPADTTPPTISAIATSNVTTSSVTITWTTNEAATSRVEYGLTTSYGSASALNSTATTSHSRTLTGLSAGTSYHFRVRSADAAGNEAVGGDRVFTTQTAPTNPPPDTTAPTISAVTTSNVTTNSVTISWTTNEPATSRVEYGTTTSYGSTSALNSALTTSHSRTLSGLTAGTIYNFRPRSADSAGNEAVGSNYTVATQAAPTQPPPTGDTALKGHWKFDEGSGAAAADSSASGFTGALANGAGWTTGRAGSALLLNGNGAYMSLPSADLSGNAMTIVGWVRFSSFPSGNDQRIVSKANGPEESAHWWMLGHTNNGANRLRFRLKTGSVTTTLVASSGNLSTNTWYHVAAVYDGSTMRLYLNGAQVGSMSKSGSIAANSSVPLNVGSNPNGYCPLNGSLDDLRIYQRALSATEIAEVMNGQR